MMTPIDSSLQADERARFEALQTLLVSVEGIDSFLRELAGLAAAVVEPPASCGITTRYGGEPLTVASSDGLAAALDETQYDAHQGPCLHAMVAGEVVQVTDAGQETRWPPYVTEARKHGLRSSLSLPLLVRGESVGAMNLYSRDRTHAFDQETRRTAELFAAQASTALLLVMRQLEVSTVNEQLETALGSRSVIDQALGALMAQQRCTAEEAFAILRAHSQNNNRKLRDVAADVVARVSGAAPVDARTFGSRD